MWVKIVECICQKRGEKKLYKNKTEEKEALKSSTISDVRFYVRGIIITLTITVLVRVMFAFVETPTESMMPTFCPKDIAICYRQAYRRSEPRRGDIISFEHCHDGEDKKYLKRVIGVAGDVIFFLNGHVYINGEKYDESAYIAEDVETNGMGVFVVPEGCVFVMGDNRENSNDSRYWDKSYVSIENIGSKVILILPFHKLYK